MNPILKNILIFILGWILGSAVNMGILSLGGILIPLPEGVDPADMESIKANIHLYEFRHFIPMFLAHAMGTLIGAFIVAKFAASQHFNLAIFIGGFFLLGGIAMAIMIPAPLWVEAADLIVAYFPMAWLGWKLAGGKKKMEA